MTVQDSPFSKPLPRREFLRVSATAVAGIAATTLITPSSLFASESNLPLLSIGYTPSIPQNGRQAALAAAASGILVSDPTFLSRRARVSVAGFARAEKHVGNPDGMELDAIFPVLSRTPDKYPAFHAWSIGTNGERDNHGGTVSFTMPVTAADGIAFLIHPIRHDAKSDDPTKAPLPDPVQSRVRLAVNSDGDAKLTRGAYVFAFRESDDDRAPSWSLLSLVNSGGFLTVPYIGVSYAVVTIDYATEPGDLTGIAPAK